jgi:hypothetical protein
MSRQVPSSSLAVSLSTRRVMLSARMTHRLASVAGADGLDVDATSALGGWLAARLAASDAAYVPVRTLWLPAGELQSSPSRRLIESMADRQSNARLCVVAALPAGTTLHELTGHLALAAGTYQSLPVVLGLPSAALKGGRPHLVQLGGIRRFAEEWDLTVAIDLSGQFDPTWEAEAAVARLGERLGILRINASAASRAAVGRDRVACRALHAAMDRDHFLEVAVAPVKTVPFPITPRVATSGTYRAVDYIAERAALHARALREGISRYEGSPSSHGI